jgi:hypothetical protein
VYDTNNTRPVAKTYNVPGGRPATADHPIQSPYEWPTISLKKSETTAPFPAGFSYETPADLQKNTGNVAPEDYWKQVGRSVILGAASFLGNPMTQNYVGPIVDRIFAGKGQKAADIGNLNQPYTVVPFFRKKDLENWSISKYKDFRAFKGVNTLFDVTTMRLDGASAVTRGFRNLDAGRTATSIAYAAASVLPGGVYSTINLESIYGWGDHGSTTALRRDFTARSHVATRWDITANEGKGAWAATLNPIEKVTEFRGDRINVIEYGKRTFSEIYRWKPSFAGGDKLKKIGRILDQLDLTKDFIKFYFTGPNLHAGSKHDKVTEDDIIVFRATIDSVTDSHSPSWQEQKMVGRADPNYTYTGYSREVSLSFTIIATDRDEMKPIWRKLNALASYTTPEYSTDAATIALKAPWLRLTLGDLFYHTPVLINTLTYTLHDSDTTWETNVEEDSTMMQAPHKISVQMGLHIITDVLPQKNGRMYSLAKSYDIDGNALQGGDNWLSDFKSNEINRLIQEWIAIQENPRRTQTLDKPSENVEVTNIPSNLATDALN